MARGKIYQVMVNRDGFAVLPGLDENLDDAIGAGIPSPYDVHTTQRYPLGTILWDTSGGRQWRYALAGATALLTGKMMQSAVPDTTGFNDKAVTATAVGATTVNVTPGAVTPAANFYAGGFLHVNDDTGEGYTYRIKSHPVVVSATAFDVELYDSIQVALTTASTVSLTQHKLARVIVHPSPATAPLVGVTNVAVAASKYFWLQTKGPCSVLTEGTIIINEGVIDSASADGAVAPTASSAAGEENYVGVVLHVNATTEYSLIDLRLD